MSKEKIDKEQILEEDPFKGFSLLNEPAPKSVTKKEVITEEKEEELTKEELEAVEKTAKQIAESKDNKKKAKEEIDALEVEDESKEVVEDENDLNVFLEFAKQLNEKGVIDLDPEDKVESDEDLDKLVSKTIKKGVAEYKASKPEDVQKFLDFVDNGGNPSDFHKYYYGDGGSFESFNIESEENQKYVIEEALKLEDWTEEEIKDELTNLEDLGTLDRKASIYLRKLQKIEKEQKSLLIEAQKAYALEQESRRNTEWNSFKKGLFEKETIGGFKITPKVQNELWEYMTKPVNKKIGKTQYQLDSEENADARYMFAYLLKNKWDIKSLEKQVETKEVSKLKAKLNRYSDNNVKKTGVKNDRVSDDNDNPLAGFKKMFS